ncbi:multisubunit sodium/proton antiporter MrpD subunit [Halanaerobium saccharolyticum]|uniref:Multisubunit sodium/proton antiporter MrpD subunit n=1 Tax=Halanaerobium saccharolyticum TaxID=43595 RepID=A0A4R6LKP8_9FIRM|nr:proton-conducting transporter membrane subunit [Halanaerobium saccharolyticum]TDO85259.1 multisubunit sodium/proton antiporter MrpD subunit [Halanaerobium saccharolyticum]
MSWMNIELVLLIVLPAVIAVIMAFSSSFKQRTRNILAVTGAGIELCLVFSLFLLNFEAVKSSEFFLQFTTGYSNTPFVINFAMDNLSLLFSLIVTAAVFLIVIFSTQYIRDKESRYFALFFLVLASIQGSILTADLFTLYLFIEAITVFTTPLISFKKTEKTTRAALQYFFYGITGGVFFFISIILIYFNLGTLKMAAVADSFALISTPMQLTIIIFFLLALLIKLGIFPIHFWLPRAHSACPAPISALLSGVLLKVYLYIFMRLFWTMIAFDFLVELHLSAFVLDLALVSSLIGHVFALQADELKKMLAYSSIGHIGMILAVLMLNTEAAFYGGLLHIIAHMMMKSGLFLSSGYLLRTTLSHHIDDLKGIGHKNRLVFIAFIIICLGTIGMPPLIGFVSKWFVLLAFLEARHYFGAFVVGAGSIIALIYYLRYISQAYETVKTENKTLREELVSLKVFFKSTNIMKNVIYLFTLLIIIFGLSYQFFEMPINTAIFELLNPQKYIELVLGG